MEDPAVIGPMIADTPDDQQLTDSSGAAMDVVRSVRRGYAVSHSPSILVDEWIRDGYSAL